MKKKAIALILYVALLLTSVFPATALAEGDTQDGTPPETPVCGCTLKCSEGSVDPDCPVCSAAGADLSACTGREPQPLNEQGGEDTMTPADQTDGQGGSTPTPAPTVQVCTCTLKCAEGAADAACPVCAAEGADLSACTGKAAESGEGENNSTPTPAPTAPVCTCTLKCAEGAANDQCPVCAADWNNCAFTGANGEPEDKPETITLTEWSWVDEQKALSPDGKLYLPSAVAEEDLEEIIKLLPQYIQAGEEKIALTWTYDEATGIFTAALPEGYALAEGAKALTIETVDMGADTLEEISATYIDANGEERTVKATVVTEESKLENNGWVVVNNNVTIDNWVQIIGNVNLILADGCTLTVTAGIGVEEGNSLTIYAQKNGTGALFATGKTEKTAGIGGSGNYVGGNANCGTVNIYGGTVTATGGIGAAGIGGGYLGSGSNVNIRGGTVTATAGTEKDGIGGAGIGAGGGGGSGGSLNISGGTTQVCANSNGGVAAITDKSNQTNWDGIVFENGVGRLYGSNTISGSLTIAEGQTLEIPEGETLNISGSVTCNGTIDNGGTLNISGSVTVGSKGTIDNKGSLNVSGSVTCDGIIDNSGTVSVSPGGKIEGSGFLRNTGAIDKAEGGIINIKIKKPVSYMDEDGEKQTVDAIIVTADDREWISESEEGSWYVVEDNVTISGTVTTTSSPTNLGTVNLILADGYSLTVKGGIDLYNSLAIYGQEAGSGCLNADATGYENRAGIGKYDVTKAGSYDITINGGVITATGGSGNAAGMGGGGTQPGAGITINGGTVYATGSGNAAGIGALPGGYYSVKINGGTVTAFGGKDGGAGIGGGQNLATSGGESPVIITGGTVYATGNGGGAGIGGTKGLSAAYVAISGGTVYATGSGDAAGLGYGSGYTGDFREEIIISGGTLTVTGGDEGGAGITSYGNEKSSIGTGANGGAVIYLNDPIYVDGSPADMEGWNCIVFDNTDKTGQVYGIPTVSGSLNIEKDWTLTVPQEAVLFNTGRIGCAGTIENQGSIKNLGTIEGSGVLKNQGEILNQGTITLRIEGDTELDKKTVSYVDENGIEKQAEATLVTPLDREWGSEGQESWYVVEGPVTIDDMLWLYGDVNLILADGCSLTVNGGILVMDDTSFTVYAQRGGSGRLSATGYNYDSYFGGAGIGGAFNGAQCGTIIIRGGIIQATGGSGLQGGGAGIGADGEGSSNEDSRIIISGGTVTATGGSGEQGGGAGIGNFRSGSITISGGTVTATGGSSDNEGGAGISAGRNGSITISGGTVTATGENGDASNGAGIDGSFSTGAGGTALIYATGGTGAAAISDQSGKGSWSGIIFEGDAGAVYGNQSKGGSFTIATDQTLEILSGSSFTNSGTLTIDGALTNNGSFTNNGPVTVPMTGSFANSGTLDCNYHSFDNGACVICGGTAVSGISLDKPELELKVGGTATITAKVSPDNASSQTLAWASSDDSIATVDQDGKVTAHKAGTATITVSATDGSGVKAECVVTVTIPVSSVTMSRSSLRIYEGRGYTLSASVSPQDAADKNLIWSSSDPDIATVDQNGNVTGKAPGVCVIYATAADGGGAAASCTVRVLRWYPGATPITGDSSNLGLWIGVLAVSACAIAAGAFILIKKRKR